jgi:hypothetical protein
MREQGVILEDKADMALLRRHLPAGFGDQPAGEFDAAALHRLKPCGQPQESRLPIPGRAEQADDLSRSNLKIDPPEHLAFPEGMVDA